MNDFEEITSRENNRLKYARKVREGKLDVSIFVEGSRLSAEALRSGLAVEFCLVTRRFIVGERGRSLISKLAAAVKDTFVVSEDLMRSVADTETSQGIVLVCKRPEQGRETIERKITHCSAGLSLVIYLQEINIPANLGSILRTAEAAVVTGIIISGRSADPFSPKALRGSMGSAFRLAIWEQVDFGEAIEWSKRFELRSTGTAAGAETNYTSIDWKQPRLLIFGSEGHGLSEEQLRVVEDQIRIPMKNGVESLNVAVACGILLFEAGRQVDSQT